MSVHFPLKFVNYFQKEVSEFGKIEILNFEFSTVHVYLYTVVL